MAKLDTTAIDKWATSIRDNAFNWKITQTMRLVPVDASGKRVLDALSQPEFFAESLKEVVQDHLLGPEGVLNMEFHARSESMAYWPRYLPKDDRYGEALPVGLRHGTGSSGGRAKRRSEFSDVPRPVTMDRGFSALWSAISQKPVFRVEGTRAIAGIGPAATINSLRLSDYMGTSGRSDRVVSLLNNLFLAVEFGTGVEENVGNAAFVRHTGPTKVRTHYGPGAWVYTNKYHALQGGLFIGQKGFHFLYDARTRRPLPIYIDVIKRWLPKYIEKRLSTSIQLQYP